MSKSLVGSKVGVSQVVEMVIIVAIGIVIAVATTLWISGLIGSSMSYENIGVISQGCQLDPVEHVFKIQIRVKNTGASTMITGVLVNNVPLEHFENVELSWMVEGGESGNSLPIPAGTGLKVDLNLAIPDGTAYEGGVLTRGVLVSITLQAASGNNYPLIIDLS